MKNSIQLIQLNETHLEKMVIWRSSKRINDVSSTDVTLNIEGQINWFRKIIVDETKVYFAIYLNDIHVGIAYIFDINHSYQSCSFGIYIGDEKYLISGVGYISEIKLINYVFEVLKINRLHCEVLSGNKNVIKLHKKIGFEEEGLLRQFIKKNEFYFDVHVLSILKSEWNLHKIKYAKYLI
jgi:UDP-4-amino-4,6-dideoxy-N-acetyl-beta-L-altrosamine N-acetyltransferase